LCSSNCSLHICLGELTALPQTSWLGFGERRKGKRRKNKGKEESKRAGKEGEGEKGED